MRKQEYNDFKDFLNTYNINILMAEEIYNTLGTNDDIEVRCTCNNIYKRTYYKFKRLKHKLCDVCNNEVIKNNKSRAKRQEDKFKEIINGKGLILTYGTYINQKSRIGLLCHSCGCEFSTNVEYIFNRDCSICKSCKLKNSSLVYSIEKRIEMLNERGYQGVEFIGGGLFRVKCICGGEVEREYNILMNSSNSRCKPCSTSITPLSIEEVELNIPKNLTWVAGVYKNQNSKLHFNCECGGTLQTTLSSLKGSTIGCKKCATLIRVDKTRIIRELNGDWVPTILLGDKILYNRLVDKFTKINSDNLDLSIIGRAGVQGAYHVDHMYSKFDGFKNNIPPWIIGSRYNLQIIPWEENLKKGRVSTISVEEIYKKIGY